MQSETSLWTWGMIRKVINSALIVLGGFLPVALIECTDAAHIALHQDPSRAQYGNWVRPYTSQPLTLNFRGEVVRLRLVITAIEGDEEISSQREPSIRARLNDRTVAYGCYIFADGRIHYFYRNSMGVKGSGNPTIPESELERMDKLLSNLPDDGACLPPAGRRLVVQAPDGDRWRLRVYDRANSPAVILELLRLSHSGIRSWVPQFKPSSEWAARDSYSDVALCISPDGRQIISSSGQGPLRFWDPETREVVKEVSIPQDISVSGISLSPDGAFAAIQGWGDVHLLETKTWRSVQDFSEPIIGRRRNLLSHPEFTSDGRFLSLRSSKPALLVYDTKTCKRRQKIPDNIPRYAIAYVPSPTAKRAVYLSKSAVLTLWDADQRREIAKLDDNVRLDHVAFSPDESMVAVATAHKVSGGYWRPYRIRIWKAEDGTLAHELRPFEREIYEAVEGVLWWQSCVYLLAATKADNFFTSCGVDVWNVKSGRHRGELIGCPTNLTELGLFADSRRLASGCADGRSRIWAGESAIKQIAEFERSLVETK